MAKSKGKTISGAMDSFPNLEHNTREHIPPNSEESRRNRNVIYSHDINVTIEQVYEKVFQAHYEEWREREIKKGRGKRFPPTYYEKIVQDKQKKPVYEVIWQIGDMMDTGFLNNMDEALLAEQLLDEFADFLLSLPEICVVTDKKLNDPDWKPPFDAGLIVHHMVYHGDENSPHIHMTFIPYTSHSKTGSPVQNAFAQTFEDMGYPTLMKQAVNKDGELVWQTDKNGNKIPQMKRDHYGGVDWVEKQKEVLQELMAERFGWERIYKGSNPRGNMLLSDYRREKAAERARIAETSLDEVEVKLEFGEQKLSEQQKKQTDNEAILSAQQRQLEVVNDELEFAKTAHEKQVESYKNEIQVYQSKKAEIIADYDTVVKKSDEAVVLAGKAEEVYNFYAGMNGADRQYEMCEEIVQLRYDNEKKDNEIKTLKQKLNQAYEFMKQFTIGGINMLEKFLHSIGERVQQMVAGIGR